VVVPPISARSVRLRCTNLCHSFAAPGAQVDVLRDLNLETREREFLTIVGPSGCGKTTILRLLAGLAEPTEGRVERLPSAGDRSGRVLLVFQENNLFPWLNLLDNACFGLEMQGVPRAERESRCRTWIERVGLAGREKAYPHELSTGMKQRVALIRAFLSDPAVLLLDEPFAALDYQTRLLMQQDLLELWEESHRAIVFVTHDVDEAILLSDRILVLSHRPSTVIEELQVDASRPRDAVGAPSSESAELKRRILTALRLPVGQIRRS
jgi:NitT/TauT family transport system ATP-binding protein